jgi:hypothetical protein
VVCWSGACTPHRVMQPRSASPSKESPRLPSSPDAHAVEIERRRKDLETDVVTLEPHWAALVDAATD